MTPEHPYFQSPLAAQKRFQRTLALLALLVVAAAGGVLFVVGLLPLIAVVIAVVLSVIAPFFDVPGLVRSGRLRYHSPFLLAEAERNGTVVLHAGTLFDFWFLFPNHMRAGDRRRLVLAGMIEGLIHLIDEHEGRAGEPAPKVRLTSYVLSERNANRLGLEKQRTDALQTLLLVLNYVNLTASYSLLHRRLRFPSIRSVQTFEGRLAALAEHRPRLQRLRDRLGREAPLVPNSR